MREAKRKFDFASIGLRDRTSYDPGPDSFSRDFAGDSDREGSRSSSARGRTHRTADAQPSSYDDAEAGRLLLEMANRERAKAGLPPLQADDGLTKAARAHAAAMAAQQKLSHQLSGEPSLVHRLAANTKTHLDQSGENVAFAGSVDQAQDSLMHSPPHRANLLNAGYNVAGFSVVRRGSLLYVTQDFGHSLPSRSDAEAEVLVGRSVDRMRAQSHLPGLQRMDGKEAASTACAMAEADSLRTPGPRARAVLRYTTSEPQVRSRECSPGDQGSVTRRFRRRLLLRPYTNLSHGGVLGCTSLLLDRAAAWRGQPTSGAKRAPLSAVAARVNSCPFPLRPYQARATSDHPKPICRVC